MVILLDQDNVLAGFDGAVYDEWQRRYPEDPLRPIESRKEFYIDHDHPDHLRPRIEAIYRAPGFFANLQPVEGSQQAVADLIELGVRVTVCTAPLVGYPTCLQEKHDWIERWFGSDLAARMIITRDKTLVRGDILIDDKPAVTGALDPVWEHVIFDQPYNRGVNGQRRLTWGNWRTVLNL